jgi:putative ABC transport system substrate-binding protein
MLDFRFAMICDFGSWIETRENKLMPLFLSKSFSENPQSAIKNEKWAGLLAILIALTACGAMAEAQPLKKVSRIGYLQVTPSASVVARTEAFRQGLRELGYVEGQNILIEWRFAEGKADRLPALAAELARLKVEVIVTSGPTVTRSAKEANIAVPIVMTFDNDPVGNGFVSSLARPGGNITGLSSLSVDISGKQVEILKEIVPKLSRVAILGTSTNPGNAQVIKETELAARALEVNLQYLDARGSKDIETAFRAASKWHADAVLVLAGPGLVTNRKQVIDLGIRYRLPAMYYRREFVEDGGLMSYGVNFADLDRRAARYVDKILKGAKPADLPIEQPKKFEFIINLKAAKQIGLSIPSNVLARADRVIK